MTESDSVDSLEEMEEEVFFSCPYCGEPISMIVDSTISSQEYVEDCEVCCRPIRLSYQTSEGEEISAHASRLDD